MIDRKHFYTVDEKSIYNKTNKGALYPSEYNEILAYYKFDIQRSNLYDIIPTNVYYVFGFTGWYFEEYIKLLLDYKLDYRFGEVTISAEKYAYGFLYQKQAFDGFPLALLCPLVGFFEENNRPDLIIRLSYICKCWHLNARGFNAPTFWEFFNGIA